MKLKLNNMCLCCLGNRDLKSLYESPKKGKDSTMTYLTMYTECFAFPIEESDYFPKQMCSKCLLQLKSSFNFKRKCEKSYAELRDKIKCLPADTMDECSIEINNRPCQESVDNLVKRETVLIKLEEKEGNTENNNCHTDVKYEVQDECEEADNTDNTFIYELVQDCDLVAEVSEDFEKVTEPRNQKLTRSANIEAVSKCREDLDLSTFLSNTLKTVCPLCKKRCQSVSKLRDHINSAHFGNKAYYCNICNKHYMSEVRHKQKHSKPFFKKCQHCDETFDKKSAYFSHIKRHGKNLTCECGITFRNMSSLYRHRQVHKGKKVICHLCSKSFLRQDNLNEHIRRHNKDATHACDICCKKFLNGYDLKMHMARHAKEKNYQCVECDVPFRTKKDLYQHTWRHHKGEKKYSCKFCGKAFRRSDHRNVHQRSVHSLDEKHLQSCEAS